MKRVFTLLCALLLLVSSLSGVFVSAAPAEEAMLPEMTVTELAADEALLEPINLVTVASNAKMPKNYKAPLESDLGEGFVEYLQPYIAQCATEIDISRFNISVNDWNNLANLIFYESPELFSPNGLNARYNTSTYTLTKLMITSYQTYADTPDEYNAYLRGIRTARDYLVRGVKGNTSLTEVEKALVLHDRLAAWTEYDLGIYLYDGYEKNEIYSAVGPLANQSGVCQGYALAYTYLLKEAGIESDLVLSDALNHAWNKVYIDGVAYHVDVTWDDPTNLAGSSYNYYLTNTYYEHYGRVKHENFLLSSNGIWDSGHTAYDYDTEPYDTRYDNSGWWRDSETAIVLVNDDQLYFRSKNDGHVYQYDNGSTWVEAYTDGYKGQLAVNGTTLLYNTQKDVYSVDTSNGSNNLLWSPESIQYNAGYIEGLKYEKGKISVQLNNGSGNYNSSWREEMAYAEQGTPLQIVTQPKSVAAGNGQVAKITVKAQGDGLTYTWYHKGANSADYKVSSVTGATYAVTVNSSVHGRYVYCVVSDMYGNSVTTNVVRVYMGNLAKITAQPKNGVAPNGQVAKITVKATGDGLTYTWYHRGANSASYKRSSVTGATYAVVVNSSVHGRYVYCVVKDKYGNTVQTNVVRVFMGNPVKIATQPKNGVAANGKTAKVTMKASGKNVKYAWYIAKRGTNTYTKVASQTSNTFSLKMSSAWHGAKLFCVATDIYGATARTNTVTLYMGNPATIKTQPANTAVKKNVTAKVTVKASGDGLKYQWYYANKGSSSFKKLSGQTKATYSVKMSASVNGRKVYCVVKDKYGNAVKSSVATLYMGTAVKIKTQPKATTVFSGKTAKVTVKASGSGLKYQWYYASKGSSSYKKLSGQTKATYSVKMSSSVNGRKVYCVVTDKYGVSVKSTVVVLKMAQKAKITTQPKNVTGMKGETVKVSVKATGDGLKYQWYYAKKGSSSFKKISGATKASYSIKMTSSVNGRKVYCKVTDQYGNSVKSKTATLKLNSFDPLKSITGNWYSYSAYSIYSGSSTFYSATMTISSDYTARIRISSNSMFTTGTFTYDFYHEETSGDYAYYYLYNNAGELTGIYDISAKTMKIRLNNGSYIMFER